MKTAELKIILKRLYNEYIKYHIKTILFCLVLSILVAGSTSATAWLLDPAVKKIFVEKDQTKKVFLIHKKEKLPIGSFLNEEEIEDLIQCLKSKVNDLNHSVR
mgnify:CR=1 FL=1